MKRILYFDCFAGIAGDMTVAALLELGVDFEDLKKKLGELPVDGYHLSLNKVLKHGITGLKFDVHLKHDHSHDYHHSNEEHKCCGSHDNCGNNEHDHHSHSHVHRNLEDVTKIIKDSTFSEKVKKIALEMFTYVAKAEAKIHNKSLEEIHFHEVGAIDSIIDILGVAYCFDQLNIDEVYSSPISCGKGFVNCAHGQMPVPAPATLEILSNIPIAYTEIPKEITTPTGAAIIKTLANHFEKPERMKILKTGYGAGTRDLSIPNLVRISLAEVEEEANPKSYIYELSTNIDDMNPEIYSYLFEVLFKAGSLDVWLENIIMKKNRPGHKLVVMCNKKEISSIEEIIFRETSTFGIRKQHFERFELERKTEIVSTKFGDIRVKKGLFNGEEIKSSPEYEDCKKIALENRVSLRDVYEMID